MTLTLVTHVHFAAKTPSRVREKDYWHSREKRQIFDLIVLIHHTYPKAVPPARLSVGWAYGFGDYAHSTVLKGLFPWSLIQLISLQKTIPLELEGLYMKK